MRTFLPVALLGAALVFAQEPAHPEAQPHAQEGAQHGEAAQSEHEPSIWWKWANFAVLAGGLAYLINKNAGPYFRSRREEIQRGIAEAAQVRRDAEARAAEIESKIGNLAAEVESLRAQSKQEMSAEQARILKDTEFQITKIRAHAEAEIASAAKNASLELKAYSATLALELAEQQIRQKLDPERQRSLVSGFIEDLRREKPSAAKGAH